MFNYERGQMVRLNPKVYVIEQVNNYDKQVGHGYLWTNPYTNSRLWPVI